MGCQGAAVTDRHGLGAAEVVDLAGTVGPPCRIVQPAKEVRGQDVRVGLPPGGDLGPGDRLRVVGRRQADAGQPPQVSPGSSATTCAEV